MHKKTGLISQDLKDQILSATDIVHLIEGYVQLKPSGKNFLGLCPFHQEKTPSFTVSPAYQNYKCYGCGEYGDAIRFVMEMENLAFVDAVRFLADRSGIEIVTGTEVPQVSEPSGISQCVKIGFDFFRQNILTAEQGSPIKIYLQQRSISKALVDRFQLGYVGPGWTHLHERLQNQSVSCAIQESAGLIKKGDRGGYYDRLRNRLIFPIHDAQGRLLGFAGRAIGDEIPKYLNPPETALYKKSGVFYGIYEAKDDIRKKRRVIIVEGYLDVIRLHEHSWGESIATCGTALTIDHVKVIKRLGAKEVVLLFDGDRAGIKAAERSARTFLENGVDSKVVVLPEGLDPDDYFKHHTASDFKQLLDEASFDYEFIIQQTQKDLSGQGIEYQEQAIKEILEIAKGIHSSIKRELFITKIADAFQIGKKGLQGPTSVRQKVIDPAPLATQSGLVQISKEFLPEVKFLQYLMTRRQSIVIAREKVSAEDFVHKDLSSIYARFLQLNNEEFQVVKPQEFPEIFIEYSDVLAFLLQNEKEYTGPTVMRAGNVEMQRLREENERLTRSYSEKALSTLIFRLKKHKKAYEIRRLHSFKSEETKAVVAKLVKERKQFEKQNPQKA